MWCYQAKWVWRQNIWFLVFRHFLLCYCLGFNSVKTPQRLGNWFQRYKQLKDWTNNKKQKKLLALFGCTLKTVFASSDSFCLITSCIVYHMFAWPPIWTLVAYYKRRNFHGTNLFLYLTCFEMIPGKKKHKLSFYVKVWQVAEFSTVKTS